MIVLPVSMIMSPISSITLRVGSSARTATSRVPAVSRGRSSSGPDISSAPDAPSCAGPISADIAPVY